MSFTASSLPSPFCFYYLIHPTLSHLDQAISLRLVSRPPPLSSDSPGWQGWVHIFAESTGVFTTRKRKARIVRPSTAQDGSTHKYTIQVPGSQTRCSKPSLAVGKGLDPEPHFSPGLWILVDNPQISNLPLPAPRLALSSRVHSQICQICLFGLFCPVVTRSCESRLGPSSPSSPSCAVPSLLPRLPSVCNCNPPVRST